MILPDFTIDLGNGIHLDSAGRLTTDTVGGVAKFTLSRPLPIPGPALQQVFSSVGSVVPQLENVGAGLLQQVKDLDLFKALGLSEDFAKTFGKVAKIAETLASVIPFVNMAAGLLSVLGAFGGSDPMKDLITQEFNRLFARMDEDDRIRIANYTSECTSFFSIALERIDDYRIVISKPKAYRAPGEQERVRDQVQIQLTEAQKKLEYALDYDWTLPFDPNSFGGNSGYWMTSNFFTVPDSGKPQPASFPGTSKAFDHRPMVQLLTYCIQSYLTGIKTLAPEYRSTGQYAESLRSMAAKLSRRLDTMRNETLARTIYEAGIPTFWPHPRQYFILPVGALDLRADTNEYLEAHQNLTDHPEWRRLANLYTWWTPAPLIDIRGPAVQVGLFTVWTISQAAVDLANEQSERDYAALLTRSGYFTLAHLEALMRHLSTEPNRSETVTGNVETWRKPLAAFPAVVKDEGIPFSPKIEATASREPQDCKAYLTLTTQPIPSDRTIGYRLRLLTLPDGLSETPFDWYVWNNYVPVNRTRDWELHVNENSGLPLDPIGPSDPVGPNSRLFMDGRSPEQPVQQQGTIHLTADTFDWYVPVSENPVLVDKIRDGIRASHKMGADAQALPVWTEPANMKRDIGAIVANAGIDITAFGWDEGGQTWKGEKREWQRNPIVITYQLYWHEDELSISVKSRPQDRNFVVYLVVEEYLARSRQWLRTPIQVRFNGQLTYVPQSFFDAEAKAKKHATEIIKHIEQAYSISKKPGPGDPVTGWLRPGTLDSTAAMTEFVGLARQHAPDIVQQVLAQYTETNGRQGGGRSRSL